MNHIKNVFLFFAFLLCQATFGYASPIDLSDELAKRSFPPFHARYSSVYFIKPKEWNETVYAYFYNDEEKVLSETWPGSKMYNHNGDYYTISVVNDYFIEKTYIIFTDGEHQVPGVLKQGYELILNGVYDETGIIGINNFKEYISNELNPGNYAKIYFRPNNNVNTYGSLTVKVYLHYKIGNGEWNDIPGEQLIGEPYSGFYEILVDLGDADEITFCFTDNKGHWDNNNGQDYTYKKYSNIIIDQAHKEGAPLLY